ncbi:MAG: gene transfer agent family protein [Pseudomonadota bacterium]
MDNTLGLDWVCGRHTFALNIGELRMLQKNCNAGPEAILIRLRTGLWEVDDIVEILRLGLIGGGMESAEAGPMVRHACDIAPLLSYKPMAYDILAAALIGNTDDPVGEQPGVSQVETDGSSPKSTVQVP